MLTANDVDADKNTIYLDDRFGTVKNGKLTAVRPISWAGVTDIIYTPNPGFVGTERFKYMINDGYRGYDIAEVTVTVGSGTATPTPTPVADTTKPVVAITSPANGALICSDTMASYSCAYKLPGAKGATYRIEARAYDSSNNMSSSVINISSSGTGGGRQ